MVGIEAPPRSCCHRNVVDTDSIALPGLLRNAVVMSVMDVNVRATPRAGSDELGADSFVETAF